MIEAAKSGMIIVTVNCYLHLNFFSSNSSVIQKIAMVTLIVERKLKFSSECDKNV